MMTEEQKKKLKEALGDGTDWPIFTNDPQVNYEVDRHVEKEFEGIELVPWEQLSQKQKDIYIQEVEAFEKEQS